MAAGNSTDCDLHSLTISKHKYDMRWPCAKGKQESSSEGQHKKTRENFRPI